jgi:hypothetical protein
LGASFTSRITSLPKVHCSGIGLPLLSVAQHDESNKGLIIDGTWNNFPEDTISGAPNPDGASYANLLIESRRPPEIFIILKCSEPSSVARMIDKVKINTEYKK